MVNKKTVKVSKQAKQSRYLLRGQRRPSVRRLVVIVVAVVVVVVELVIAAETDAQTEERNEQID